MFCYTSFSRSVASVNLKNSPNLILTKFLVCGSVLLCEVCHKHLLCHRIGVNDGDSFVKGRLQDKCISYVCGCNSPNFSDTGFRSHFGDMQNCKLQFGRLH